MTKRELILGVLFILIVLGGPTYVLFIRQANSVKPPPTIPAKQDSHKSTKKPSEPIFNKKLNSLDDVNSIWVVVNKTRLLSPPTHSPSDLVSVGGGQYLRQEAASGLKKLISDAGGEGLVLNPLSGYRSYNTQVSVYGSEVKAYGQAKADTESARPGTSEHQTGLAIDVGGGGCGVENCFGNTAEGKWLASNAYRYGFIIRYPKDKMSITGYRYEPWHIRYVGVELATEMNKQGVSTLEEFFDLPAAPQYK